MSSLPRDRALQLLSECNGDEIWSVEHCRLRRLPEAWIAELCDGYESGFEHDSQTIYFENRKLNQYEGVRDVDLAIKLASELGVNLDEVQSRATSRRALVMAIKEWLEEN
jgi:hypothetical protein